MKGHGQRMPAPPPRKSERAEERTSLIQLLLTILIHAQIDRSKQVQLVLALAIGQLILLVHFPSEGFGHLKLAFVRLLMEVV